MRSLGTVRARVERLAAVGLPGSEPMIISWKCRHARCPVCGTDVEGHASPRAMLAGPDGAPQRVGDLLEVSRGTIDRMADADLSIALRDRQVLEEARACLAETADRGSSAEEREAAVVWLQEAARDERQQFAAARRKIAAVSPRTPAHPS